MLKKLILILFIIISATCHAENQTIALDLQNVLIKDAIHIIAEQMQMNFVLSPKISGTVTLHLHHVTQQEALSILLTSQDLVQMRLQKSFYILPRKDWEKQIEDKAKLKETLEKIAPLRSHVWQVRYAKAEDLARLLQENASSLLSKRGQVRVDSRTNIICIIDTDENWQRLQVVLQRVDIPVQQVLISTHLASVDSNFERNLGIHFDSINPTATITPVPGRYSMLIAHLADSSILNVALSALENSGHAELLSSPQLFTANQQPAAIEAGEEIPYQQVSLSGGTAIAFKKAVLSLKVTPQVLPDKKILLKLQINQDKPSKLLVQGVPAIDTRQITTSILANDGETIVLGGIYETDHQEAIQSIPFLGKIPVFGLLFQDHDRIENKRELLIFVTPKIIPEDAGILR